MSLLTLTVASADTAELPVRAAIPRPSLQFMSFRNAVGAGYFSGEELP